MFKKSCGPIVALIIAFTALSVDAQDKWIDMENCEICQHMAEHTDLMSQIKWQVYLIDNGFMSVSVVPEELKPTMAAVQTEMKKTIGRLESGEEVKMCPHCTGYGELMAAGATFKEMDTIGGQIGLFTSSDGDVVAKLHAHAKKTQVAHEAMMKAMEHGHDGHSHGHGKDGHKHDGDK